MIKFYAVAKNKEGKEVIIKFDEMGKAAPKYLYQAEKIAKAYANKNGLDFQKTYTTKKTDSTAKTLTKFYKIRKQTGSNGKNFNKAL